MILVFDAQCLLCNGWVQFLLKHDHRQKIQFASMQSTTGQRLLSEAGLRIDRLETLLVLQDGQTWQYTAAIFQVLHALGWPWRFAWSGYVIPYPIRDAAYRWVARNRYRLFGHSEVCLMPNAETAHRFLD